IPREDDEGRSPRRLKRLANLSLAGAGSRGEQGLEEARVEVIGEDCHADTQADAAFVHLGPVRHCELLSRGDTSVGDLSREVERPVTTDSSFLCTVRYRQSGSVQ